MYPILVDYYGNIIDGNHRLKANKEWKKVVIQDIKTEEDLLLARISCNTLRRTVSRKEKTEILRQLGEIYQEKGISKGAITYKIARETGMSYRWVVKYLPETFKDSIQSMKRKNRYTITMERLHDSIALMSPPKDELKVTHYRNTNFANFTISNKLFTKIRKKAKKLNTDPTTLLYTAIKYFLNKN